MKQVRKNDRVKNGSHSRDYLLASFFAGIVKILTDPKDGKALIIKTNPAYSAPTKWKSRASN